jgi:hypothetical protein
MKLFMLMLEIFCEIFVRLRSVIRTFNIHTIRCERDGGHVPTDGFGWETYWYKLIQRMVLPSQPNEFDINDCSVCR